MSPDVRECQTCGKHTEVFVYSLPGIPMSVGNCRECTERCAYPLSIALSNTECIGGIERAAQWWREAMTYKNGTYLTVEEAVR